MAVRTRYKPAEVRIQNAAEAEIRRFADSPFLWCKHVCGVDLDPHQLVYLEHLDRHQNCLLIGSRRVRKSFAVSMWLLREAATKPRSEINIHSPTLEQSKRDLKYMTDAILASEILTAYVERRLGEGIGKEYFEFVNRSMVQAKGEATSTDGLGATHQWLEEFDDMDWDTFLTRIYPTGSQIKPAYDYGAVEGCRRVVTGTIKGKGNIHRLEHPDKVSPIRFKVLPKLDCWFGVAAGIIPEDDIVMARDTLLTPAQFARTYLCLYTESRGYFPTSSIEAAKCSSLLPATIVAGQHHPGSGPVTFGMDFEGQGDSELASKTAIVFVGQPEPGNYQWLYGKEWPVGTPPSEVREEIVELCRYFKPVAGVGDAYGASEIYEINRDLYRARLCRTDPAGLKNKAGKGGWDDWFFRPVRFHGRQKHLMFKRLQSKMLAGAIRWPVPVEDHPMFAALGRFLGQLENIKARQTREGYDAFTVIRRALGDDLVDATVASLWAQSEKKAGGEAFGGAARARGFRSGHRFAQRTFRRN